MYKRFNEDKYDFLNLKGYGVGKNINVATVESVGTRDVKPFKIVAKSEKGSKHGKQTALTCLTVAPGIKLHSISKRFNEEKDYILSNNIKIIFSSTTGSMDSKSLDEDLLAIDELKRKGVIFLNASGNNDNRPEGELVTSRKCINIGTVDLAKGKIHNSNYGRENDYTDFASFGSVNLADYPNPDKYDDYFKTFIGTSFSTPLVAAIVALILEKANREGYDLNQEQIYSLLKDNAYSYGLSPRRVGNGVISLPKFIDFKKYVKEEVVDKEGGQDLEFKDVDKDRWYYQSIKNIADKGIMRGYEDKTFRPGANITRAELAETINNLIKYLDK